MQTPDRHELNAGWTLPTVYDVDRLVLMPRDPHKLYAYWELTPRLEQSMRVRFPDRWEAGKTILKLTNLELKQVQDYTILFGTTDWYFINLDADHTYQAELGRLLSDGTFVLLSTSNTVQTPRDSLSSVIDPRWRMFALWQHHYYRRILGGLSSAEFCSAYTEASGGGLR